MTAEPEAGLLGAIDQFRVIVGSTNVLIGSDVSVRFDGYPATDPIRACCIVRPASSREVSLILACCNDAGLKVVPQGGRTGMAGGARTEPRDVVISLERMRTIGPVDRIGRTVAVDAGVALQALQDAARDAGLFYPVDLGARGSATMGGTIATTAGGNSVFRFGMTREQVLGLEVVLADGKILSSMNRLIKNNTGYDLKQLFVGSEGTLGVITQAVLRLRPDPGPKATAIVGIESFAQVLELLVQASGQTDGALTSFEVMWRSFLDTVVRDGHHTEPFGTAYPFYVLIEIASQTSASQLEAVLGEAWESRIIADAVIAQSLTHGLEFWVMRDDIDGLIGAMTPVFLYDVSLPLFAMDEYVTALEAKLMERWAGARLVVFGHIADGNLHLFVSTGSGQDHAEVDEIVYDLLRPIKGSISAEHGIGLEKMAFLDVSRSAQEIAAMRAIKAALDPRGTLNPGKIFR